MKTLLILITALFVIAFHAETAITKNQLIVGAFSHSKSGEQLPVPWEPLTFKKIDRHTQYMMDRDGDIPVIKAVSRASASGLIRKIRIDPEKYPIIKWRWKITNIYKNGDAARKDGDDFPARIYVAFEYDSQKVGFFEKIMFAAIKLFYGEYPPIAAINYIWGSKAPIGSITENPYTGRVKMIVVQSGKKHLNTWINEERNIYTDYIKAFGEKPPFISGVAIMTDSDNTGESAISFYGDILFESEE